MSSHSQTRADISYAPEFGGADTRQIAEREYLKISIVVSELADAIAKAEMRIKELEAVNAARS